MGGVGMIGLREGVRGKGGKCRRKGRAVGLKIKRFGPWQPGRELWRGYVLQGEECSRLLQRNRHNYQSQPARPLKKEQIGKDIT